MTGQWSALMEVGVGGGVIGPICLGSLVAGEDGFDVYGWE